MTMIRREDRENRQVLLTLRVERQAWQQALDAAFEKLGRDASVLAMPYGGSTLPIVR